MGKLYDAIVLGLGAHGSAAVYHLSKNNITVCGIDRFKPPHNMGSSHGQSRIIRQAYHESPMYVPLVMEAYKLWHELENISGKKLLLKTGGIMLGNENASVVTGAKLSAETHALSYEYLNQENIEKKIPALKSGNNTVAVIEKDAGILFPEACIKAYLEQAEKNNASLFYNEVAKLITSKNGIVEVLTDKNVYQTKKLIVSAGAWLTQLMPELNLPLTVERQVLYWFKNTNNSLQQNLLPEKLPIYIWEYEKDKMFYGFPDLGDGIKIAYHHKGQEIQPSDLRKQPVNKREVADIKNIVSTYFNIEPEFNYADVCMYTNTPDEHFIIDFYPNDNNIIIASPCSGHGFKFASWIGKTLCNMVMNDELLPGLSLFKINRFV